MTDPLNGAANDGGYGTGEYGNAVDYDPAQNSSGDVLIEFLDSVSADLGLDDPDEEEGDTPPTRATGDFGRTGTVVLGLDAENEEGVGPDAP